MAAFFLFGIYNDRYLHTKQEKSGHLLDLKEE